MLYILAYDLVTPGQDYPQLHNALAAFQAVRVQDSVWAFRRYNTDADGLVRYFRNFVDTNDRLLVVAVDKWGSLNSYGDINKA